MSAELDALWPAVAHIARARVATISAAVHAGGPAAPAQRRVAFDECHKLVGSLDSYGRTGGSALALRAAELLSAEPPDVDALTDVVRRLELAVS